MIANFFMSIETGFLTGLAADINAVWHDIDFPQLNQALDFISACDAGLPVAFLCTLLASFSILVVVMTIFKFTTMLIAWVRG